MNLLKSNKKDRIYNIFIFIVLFYVSTFWFYNCANLLFKSYNNFRVFASDDVRDYGQAAWNTSQGRLFQFTNEDSQELILAHKSKSALNAHSHVIFLLIALFYLIMPHFSSFIIGQSLFIAMSGIALYLVAKEMLTEKRIFPLLIVLIYFQYFPLTCVSRFVRPDEFSIFFVFLTLYFYLRDSIKLTLIFLVLAIFCREEIGLIFGVLGLVSYFNPSKRKYFLPLTLFGFLSFFIIRYVTLRAYPATESIVAAHYGYLGKTSLDKLTGIITHPSLVTDNIFRPEKVALFKDIFAPVLYLPFLAPTFFIPGLVILFEVMLSRSWSTGTLWWQPWYLCPLIPFIFFALIGVFEKIYQLDKLAHRIFKKHNFNNEKKLSRLIKAMSIILISFLSVYIYMRNFDLNKINNKQYQDYFSSNKYWLADTFEVLSAIKKDAKVAGCYVLMPMLHPRQYLLNTETLTKAVVDQGFYDIILISQTDWEEDLSRFDFIKEANHYKKFYYTPDISVFTKKDIPPPLDNWKFDLISNIKSSSIAHNYIIFNFADYATILENADLLDQSRLIYNIYENKSLHYAHLKSTANKLQSPVKKPLQFIPDKPLEANNYILVFAAKMDKRFGTLYVEFTGDNHDEVTIIKIDDQLRLFMLPFKITHPQKANLFLINWDSPSPAIPTVIEPILLRAPFGDPQGIPERSIFRIEIGKYAFLYNPWIKSNDPQIKRIKHPQFLMKRTGKNPLLYFMKLLRFTIPLDLYQYSWVSNRERSSEIIAIRY
jgi:uncharacterized membrane protein